MQACHTTIDECIEIYNNELSRIVNNHCPIKHRNLKDTQQKDKWLDEDVKLLLKKCSRVAERKWRKSRSEQARV